MNLEGWNASIANAKQYNRPTYSGINRIICQKATPPLSSAEPAKVEQEDVETRLTLTTLCPLCQRLHT
jgi:hypothetical protein